ncbi:efflux transporter outer membrane subunit [Brackiella oedipodis]|uniref:efflux transporter outer membrane subunit n=1 Tax=Brackiella oedipodis TaxID=124225 RepID=UPI000571FEC7|nr:efflux transporter outer membrane subunit [Brackiella oedipodis]
MFRYSVLTLSLILAGCSLAPKYERPQAPIPATYDESQTTVNASQASAADLGWKEFIRDPRLQALVAAALDNNRDLRLAVQRVEESRAMFGITRSDMLPHISAMGNGNVERLPNSYMRNNAGDSTDVGGHRITRNFQAGIGFTNFELDLWGRRRNMTEAAFEKYLASDEARQSVQIDLIGQVATTYFAMQGNAALEALSAKTIDSYQKTFDLVNNRFKAGVATALELNQAKTTLQTAKTRKAQYKRLRIQASNALNVLVGRKIVGQLPAAAEFSQDVLLRDIPAGAPSELLTRRPDIRQAEHNLKSANANIGAARAAFFPSLSLTSTIGTISPVFSDLFDSGTDHWAFQPSLTLPIFHAGALKNSLDLAEVRKDMAVTQYEKTIQVAFQEVADALIGEETYREQLDALAEEQKAAYNSLKLAHMRYESGIDSFLEVQRAQIDLFGVQQEYLISGMQSLNNRVALYKALGGGWTADTVQALRPDQPSQP